MGNATVHEGAPGVQPCMVSYDLLCSNLCMFILCDVFLHCSLDWYGFWTAILRKRIPGNIVEGREPQETPDLKSLLLLLW